MPPKIAIVGNGSVGSALDRGLERAGWECRAVGHDPTAVRDAARWGDVVVLAVPFAERRNALDEIGPDAIRGKVLVDVTNALTPSYDFAVDPTDRSGAEELQSMARDVRVVKAFNTVFAAHMDTGEVKGERLTLFVAGDDEPAKAIVRDMGAALGFDPVDAGPLRNARWMETLGYFNIQLGMGQEMGPDIGFRLVH